MRLRVMKIITIKISQLKKIGRDNIISHFIKEKERILSNSLKQRGMITYIRAHNLI